MAGSIHRKPETLHGENKNDIKDSSATMLLEDIDRKEKHIRAIISRYLGDAGEYILDTYYRFAPDQVKELEALSAWCLKEDADIAEVVEMVPKIDAFLYAYYRRAAEMAPGKPLREMFQNLVRMRWQKRDAARPEMPCK
jgi:hypothetical protein